MNAWTERYLLLLGLEAPETPDLGWLREFGAAHLRAVPFSNVTSLLRRQANAGETVPPLDHEAQLALWEQRTGGGVCFEVAEMVSSLLRNLGYEAHLVLGEIAFPGSHQAVVVRLREGPYLVDLGMGAPLPHPISLIRTTEYHVAGLGFRFRPDLGSMTCIQERLLDGEWTEFCHYDLRPADDSVRHEAYQRHHIPGETWVTSTLTLMRYFQDEREIVTMREGGLTKYSDDGKHSVEITTDAEYEMLCREYLRWPELPVSEALRALRRFKPA